MEPDRASIRARKPKGWRLGPAERARLLTDSPFLGIAVTVVTAALLAVLLWIVFRGTTRQPIWPF